MVKGHNLFNRLVILTFIFIVLVIPTVSKATYSIGMEYNFSLVNKDSYIDENGHTYTSENDINKIYTIYGINQTALNYTLFTSQPQVNYDTLSNGNWVQNQYFYYPYSSSGSQSLTHFSENISNLVHGFSPFIIIINNPIYPGWGESYFNSQYPYIGYTNRYHYFDKANDSIFDQINIGVNPPDLINAQNISGSINFMKNRINDWITGETTSFKDKIFNASNSYSQDWYSWAYTNLNPNVAYTPTLLNSISGIIDFHPAWLGSYNYLYSNVNPNPYYQSVNNLPYTTSFNGSYILVGSNQFYSQYTLNQKVNDTSKYTSIIEIQNGLRIDINVPFRTQNVNYFYQPPYSAVGSYSFHIDFQYDSNGFLTHKSSKAEFNANSYGEYIMQSDQSINNTTTNALNQDLILITEILAVPVFLTVGASVAILLKRRNHP